MNNSIYGTTDPDYEQDGFQISQERCEGFSHCVNICPVEALTLVEGYVNEILNIRALYVQLDTCIMCGVCEPECPTEAIMLRLSGGSPGTTPGTNPGSDGGGTGGNSGGSFSAIAPVSTINLEDRLNCFNNVVDNINTTYKVTLNAHRIDLNSDKPGHAYLTIEKSNGNQLQRLSYGFYPKSGAASATMQPTPSAMGEESSDEYRKSDARYSLYVTKTQFNAIISQSIALSKVPYDLNDNNCTHYATDVFNLLLPSNGQLNNNGFLTPDGVYTYLANLKQEGNPNIQLGRIVPPASTNCN
ncbi:ferredoxin family protein [Chryseobacterium sp. T20]|uniref:4Fe-4S dicluster domain-containing protein n=1 Tax=Chryseobacterium sp. T20 TaxID=3395375 RepID=UPI0039BC23B0